MRNTDSYLQQASNAKYGHLMQNTVEDLDRDQANRVGSSRSVMIQVDYRLVNRYLLRVR
jgi:hypothetical protein